MAWFRNSLKTQCVVALGLAVAFKGVHALYLWRLNRRLPKGIRYRTDGVLFPRNGHYDISDVTVLKRNAKVLVHPTAGARVYMGGLRETNILCSPGGLWERQKAVIHPFIGKHMSQYLSLLQSTDLDFQVESGEVDLVTEVGKYVANISTATVGLAIEGGFSWKNVTRAVLGISVFLFLGVPEQFLKCALRLVLPFTNLEQQVTNFVQSSDSSLVRELRAQFSTSETIGHIWGVINGSIIPETNMICSIMHEIGMDATQQDILQDMIRGETVETIMRNDKFEAFIAQKCREHAFFRSSSRVVEDDFMVGGHTIAKGANVRIPIAKINQMPGVDFTWGFGKRSCPGAVVGKNMVKLTVFRILMSYRISIEREPLKFQSETVNIYLFGLRAKCCKRF